METIDEPINNIKKNFIHYRKVNIFGDCGVGKSSLISLMENYDDLDNYEIIKNLSKSQLSLDSYHEFNSLVEQIKKIDIPLNKEENIYLYLNVYETNLDKYNDIKMNLDTLLLQTECIVIMWDNSEINSFSNVENLASVIISGIKQNKFNKVPIFLLQNKIDLNIKNSQSSDIENNLNNIKQSIVRLKKEYKDYLIDKEISLLNQDDFQDVILEINRNISNNINNDNTQRNLVKLPKNIIGKNNDNDEKTIRCILLGHTQVGKTTFFNKIINNIKENNLSTIGMEMEKISAIVYNEKISITLMDTAGQERFRSISKNYISNVDGILLMFDVTNVESFSSVDDWISSIKENKEKHNNIIILIGNKIDSAENRLVSKSEAKKKADKYNIKYYEMSCLNGLNLYEILNELILVGYRNYYEKNQNVDRNSFKLKKKNINNKNNNNNNSNCKC